MLDAKLEVLEQFLFGFIVNFTEASGIMVEDSFFFTFSDAGYLSPAAGSVSSGIAPPETAHR